MSCSTAWPMMAVSPSTGAMPPQVAAADQSPACVVVRVKAEAEVARRMTASAKRRFMVSPYSLRDYSHCPTHYFSRNPRPHDSN